MIDKHILICLLILLPLGFASEGMRALPQLLLDIQSSKFPECSLILTAGSSKHFRSDINEFSQKSRSPIYQIRMSEEFASDIKTVSQDKLKRCRSFIFLLHTTSDLTRLLKDNQMAFLENISFNDKIVLVTTNDNVGIVKDITTSDFLFENLLNFVLIGYNPHTETNGKDLWEIFATQFFIDKKRLSYKYLGSWNIESTKRSVEISNLELFPPKMTDFYGHEFRISTFHFPPKVSYNPSTNIWSGVEIELTKLIAKKLNFKPTFIEPADGKKWGSEENGTFTGLMGDIVYRMADLGFCNLFITNDRLTLLDMTIAYHIDYACFLTPAPSLIPQYMAIVYPFDLQLWGCILLAFVFFIPMVHLTFRKTPLSKQFGWLDSSWNMYCEFTAGFYIAKINTNKIYYKLFTGGAWAFVLIITWSYKESIKAFLTVPARQTPINSLEQLLKSNLKWGVRNSGGWPDWFKDSSDPLSQAIYEGFIYVENNEEGVQKVWNGDYAFMNSRTFLEYLISSNYTNKYREKELHITSQCFVPFRIGLAMPLFSPYKKVFDEAIISIIEAGLIELWLANSNLEAERTNRATHNTDTFSSNESKVSAMSVHDIQGVFFMYGIGTGLACLSFGIEQIRSPRGRK